jgi:small subunit ribosomal protein S4
MARYTESKCRLCRREGGKLFLKGDKCYGNSCPFEKRPVAPGQHGSARKKVSEYGLQLREKQKTKRIYGLLEGQFHHYYEMADRMKGITGENMLSLLERRLDNVIYRMGVGASRNVARQLVTHAHFTVNGRPVNIPSYLVKAGDVIAVKESRKDNKYFTEIKQMKKGSMPQWLDFNPEKLEGKIIALPKREDIDTQIAEHMIVELYSK